MKILITGHRGFIGSALMKHISGMGYEISGYDIGDVFPSGRFDFIVHLAARGLIRKSVELPYDYFADDLEMAMRFLEKSRKEESVFIFPSSGSADMPTNPYSLSKKQAVEWISLYRKLYGIQAFDLKFFNIYGEGSRKGGVYLFSKMALAGGPVTILGDGKDIRDFVYITDVVKFLHSIIEGKVAPGSYEVGTGIGTSIEELVSKVISISGMKMEILKQPDTIETARKLVASRPALKEFIPLDEGIRKVMEFIREDQESHRNR